MKARKVPIAIAAVLAALALTSPAGAAIATESSLSDSSALSSQTISVDSSGDTARLSVTPDSASTLTLASDGYYCGNVGYNGNVKWYDPFGIVVWTYHSHFAVHVCHNRVGYVTSLYDEPLTSTLTWSWCGNIVKEQLNTLPYSSARSYTKGCFDAFYKLADARYPWVRMTIGGNGGLWARSWGVA